MEKIFLRKYLPSVSIFSIWPFSSAPASPAVLKTVVFSKLNSETTFNPDRSENGKNLAKNNKIRPQNTVFWDLESRRNKSAKYQAMTLNLEEKKKNLQKYL